jgi:hypothetical protein
MSPVEGAAPRDIENRPIDLRSDTVTRPTSGMRAAIAAAPVGDDQYGEDPTINALQDRVARLLGKEAALWLPSGTMANQVALRVLTRPGDDVIVSRESHAVWHETGASAANAGVQFTEVGARGVFSVAEFLAAVKPRGHPIYPPTTLFEVERFSVVRSTTRSPFSVSVGAWSEATGATRVARIVGYPLGSTRRRVTDAVAATGARRATTERASRMRISGRRITRTRRSSRLRSSAGRSSCR